MAEGSVYFFDLKLSHHVIDCLDDGDIVGSESSVCLQKVLCLHHLNGHMQFR